MNIYIVELFLYLFCAIGVFWVLNLYRDFKQLHKYQIILIFLFVYLVIVSQVNKSPFQTYPFTYWGMYSEGMPSQSYEEYLIELDNGIVKHYPFELITFTSQRAFMRKLKNIEQQTAEDDTRKILSLTITSLVDLYEQRYPGQTIQTFTINRVHISLTGDESTYVTSRTPLFVKEFTP